jgi:DNA repair protein RadC
MSHEETILEKGADSLCLLRGVKIPKIKFSYYPKVNPNLLPKISCSADAHAVLKSNWDPKKFEFVEQFKVMLLSRSNRVIGILNISTGGTAGTIAEPKLVFAPAITSNASSVIVAHNHPSGNLKPSQADIDLTKKLKAAGGVLDIPVLDHLIIAKGGYFSFADEGTL